MREQIKNHVKKYKVAYSCIATGVVVAGITTIIMRRRYSVVCFAASDNSNRISRAIGVAAGRDIVVTRKSVLNNVSYISSNRKGAPSWVIRCLETDVVFTSQRAAAIGMELSEKHISSHLNGVRDNVNGYTFERICMAA
jgi:hypothetical protein